MQRLQIYTSISTQEDFSSVDVDRRGDLPDVLFWTAFFPQFRQE